ncbi:hypothetical protein Tco_0280503 [Tanacetum coccineum]
MPTFSQPAFSQPAFPQPNQSIFSQPAVHFQQTQPTQTNQTGQQYPNNVQSQQFQQFQTASISANNAKFPYLEKDKYEIWAMKMEYWIQNADHNLWRIVQQGNSPKRLGKDAKEITMFYLKIIGMDIREKEQKESQKQTNPSTGRKGPSQVECCALVSQARRLRQQQLHQQQVPPNLVELPIVTMADNRTMAELLQAPTEGYEDAIVVPEIEAANFEIKHGLLTLVQNKQFFGNDKEDPHAHILTHKITLYFEIILMSRAHQLS